MWTGAGVHQLLRLLSQQWTCAEPPLQLTGRNAAVGSAGAHACAHTCAGVCLSLCVCESWIWLYTLTHSQVSINSTDPRFWVFLPSLCWLEKTCWNQDQQPSLSSALRPVAGYCRQMWDQSQTIITASRLLTLITNQQPGFKLGTDQLIIQTSSHYYIYTDIHF